MKILVIHNEYQQYGGEDLVVQLETSLLKKNGNICRVHTVSNNEITSLTSKVRVAFGLVFSISSYLTVKKSIRDFKPDVVHVHNFFPLISPSVFYACRAARVPVVLTLHNYRTICPTALLMHNGSTTERSLKEGPWWAVKHRVYKNSLVGTFLLALMIALHQRVGTWRFCVNRFIVLSQFARNIFIAAGFPENKLSIKPNFVDLPLTTESERAGLLFVGRLSPEKGITVLLDAGRILLNKGGLSHDVITLAGTGSLLGLVENSGFRSLGPLNSGLVHERMRHASALLLPSVWYEGFPMVLVEAYASSLPVIASRIGALAELVEDGVTGLLFDPGDSNDLANKMAWALNHPKEMHTMGVNARLRYEKLYSPMCNYEALTAIYLAAIGEEKRNLRHEVQ